ncbi:MAG: hypothetical protein M3437_15645 [Chloroflexota bacterium]|nr:hypothetical protein [Chloroflexota bacterium]
MRRAILLVAVMLIAVLVASTVAYASHSWTNSKGEAYHWARTSNPFTLKLGDNVTDKWQTYLETTSSNGQKQGWDDSSELETDIVTGGTNPKRCSATSGRVEVCNAKYGNTGWLGVAGIYVSGDHITKGYSKLNDTYFDTAKYNTPGWRNLVMCQEVGHTLGLDHQDENFDNPNLGTCQDYTRDPDGKAADPDQLSNEYPDQHDYDQLASIYKHLDSTTTVGQTSTTNRLPAAANQAADDSDPSKWGQLIRLSPDGRLALYRQDLGGGHKLFRFVIWADGAPQANRDARH